MTKTVRAQVSLTRREFYLFAAFDELKLKKRLRAPAIFAAIMLSFAALCRLFFRETQGSGLLSTVLTSVGLGLPLVYFGFFSSSLISSAKAQKLPRAVYEIELSGAGLTVKTPAGETVSRPWKDMFAAYKRKTCVYLYAAPQKAFLLPNGQSDATDEETWELISKYMPRGRAV